MKKKLTLVMYREFHKSNRWTTAPFPYLIYALMETFSTTIVESQVEYNQSVKDADFVFVTDVGWSAPELTLDKEVLHMAISGDPWGKPKWFQRFVEKHCIDFVLTPYPANYTVNCPATPKSKVIEFPWFVPDEIMALSKKNLSTRNADVIVLGTTRPRHIYDVRAWCCQQRGVVTHPYSGVDNKKYVGIEYYRWLSKQDAIVYAMSSNPKYSAVVAKSHRNTGCRGTLFCAR